MTTPYPLTRKARALVQAKGWLTVAEGAIRSGKTVATLLAWILYLDNTPERYHLMSGRTRQSLLRNVINGDYGLLSLAGKHARLCKYKGGEQVVRYGKDRIIYLSGANDDNSYTRIKGLTIGGWYADEVATYPLSYINEALARSAISTDRRIWWTLNPTLPSHPIYTQFLDRYEGREGYNWYHFTLRDNPAMTAARREELAQQYTGRYYQQLILGRRVAPEGAIYDMFDKSRHIISTDEAQRILSAVPEIIITCDYGTANPCVYLACIYTQRTVYVLAEYYWDSRKQGRQKTDAEYVQDMQSFVGALQSSTVTIIVDPSAASYILALRNAGYVVLSGKNDVLPGIRRISTLLSQDRIKISAGCTNLLRELIGYQWDSAAVAAGQERPRKIDDHAPDALRYYINSHYVVYDI